MSPSHQPASGRPLIVANWKMNTSLTEALILAGGVKKGLESGAVTVVLCPPFPWLVPVAERLRERPRPNLFLGAQNLFWQAQGPYTGEVSALMLTGLADYVILGHSERRRHFHESDAEVAAKVKQALAHHIIPIVCLGEARRPEAALLADPSQLTAGQVHQTIQEARLLRERLTGQEREQLVLAYEPLWAISGQEAAEAASGLYANQVAGLIKEEFGHDRPVLYGGSVSATNAGEFLTQSNLSGLLVGSASLKLAEFLAICQL